MGVWLLRNRNVFVENNRGSKGSVHRIDLKRFGLNEYIEEQESGAVNSEDPP